MDESPLEVRNQAPHLGERHGDWADVPTVGCRAAELADLLTAKRSKQGTENRWLTDASEGLFLVLEGVALALILIAMKFHPATVALSAAWGLFHVLALIRRVRRQKLQSESLERGIRELRTGEYPKAAEAFAESLSAASYEPAWVGRVYALGMAKDGAEALKAARTLYHEHLSGRPNTVLLEPEYRLLIGEPAYRSIAKRLESVLNGDPSEVFHYLPLICKTRMLQTAIGVFFVMVVAFFLTLALTLR